MQEEAPAAGQVPDEAPARRVLDSISVTKEDDRLEIWLQGNQVLEYTSIKQSFPFAVSVYLPDTSIGEGLVPGQIMDQRIGGIKAGYADGAKTTVKVDILLTADLQYTVSEQGSRLGILFHDTPSLQAPQADKIAAQDPQAPASPQAPLVIPDTPARLSDIQFDAAESGASDIFIKTTHPVKYDTRQAGPDMMYLTLFNTKIPAHHQRPLLTRYFNSAVERVDPRPCPGQSSDTRIDIKIREQVPFSLVQTQDGIHMSFEPSSVTPPEFTKARKPLVSGAAMQDMQQQVVTESSDNNPRKMSTPAFNPGSDPVLGIGSGPYTGEKIKLDFFDTDIKNVFRILKSVSGLNFAIDQDVRGKVTLSLGQAVPWDQVLDLVLKMNSLGKKMEGNVVRIATVQTLQREEKLLQDAIAAHKKSIEQKKALEPLFTEYIPINYSSANDDIAPHVRKILTPDRGQISVDKRTNMIIITDTRKIIDQANELIFRLDKVTPQIMIEAKVVEVTKDFSRTLGLSWNLSNDANITTGFVDDFNVALNGSSSVGVSGEFSFFKLFGSSVTALNASLEASEENGDVKIVSSPRIMTLDNKKATIKQGQEYAYLERDDSGGSSVSYKDIDLLLEVTPQVTPDNRISMKVKLTKNDVAGFITSGSTSYPYLDTNEAETELLVNDHDTIVIGGVVKNSYRDDSDGIPILAGIPILSYLFSQKTKEDERKELLIFLTPSIVQLEQKRNVTAGKDSLN